MFVGLQNLIAPFIYLFFIFVDKNKQALNHKIIRTLKDLFKVPCSCKKICRFFFLPQKKAGIKMFFKIFFSIINSHEKVIPLFLFKKNDGNFFFVGFFFIN